jgi:hypothetical protein
MRIVATRPEAGALRWAAVAFVLGVLVAAMWLQRCGTDVDSGAPPAVVVRTTRVVDTVVRWVSLDPLKTQVRLRPSGRGPTRTSTVDTTQAVAIDESVGRLLRERDSLASLLQDRGHDVTMIGDTVLASGDTVLVECNELLRRARLELRLAKRPVAVEYVRDSVVSERTITRYPLASVALGAGVGLSPDGVLRPGLFVGIVLPIINLFP